MYKTALLDFDGTIADTLLDIYNSIVYVFEQNDLVAPEFDVAKELMGDGLKMFLEKSLNATNNDISLADKITDEFINHYAMNSTIHTNLYDGVIELLDLLKNNNIKLAVISNKSEKFLRIIVDHFNLTSYFEVIAGGDTYIDKKPSALPILKTLEIMGVPTDEAIMIGDSKNDLLSGINAKVATCICTFGYCSGLDSSDLKADYYVDNALQILDIFNITRG